MARKSSIASLAAILIAALIQSSVAQTTHVVGNNSGWTIPNGGAAFYSTWAAGQVFSVNDILVFNFAANQHDVSKVTKADYDACTTANPILVETTSPARITINETGVHYFICNFTGHCSAGQKLMINVSAASSAPAPQPSSSSPTPVSAPSPSPVSTSPPSPAPSATGVNYTVGDSQGWNLLSNAAAFYQNWASGKDFMAGDILVFNYNNGAHDVAEVTKENYESCNTANPISRSFTPPTTITLTAGEHFYVCTIPGHCNAGQKLAVNVSSSGTGTPPSSTTPTNPSSPSPTTAPPPPDSSARSLSVAGLSATFLSIVVAFLY
ncbi:blue copper protein [Manihot esculenta]|uniref:Phytocyanin domain-containing protein n=1 Tax=Manihot esculenta TaxID=3983 RepID=A0A2C9VQE3_MANES|nr:blue copper protein [Manihot esculenta]OAY47156.1 hypothetical protein MANES_06G056500v8 [Manihot esculenta]